MKNNLFIKRRTIASFSQKFWFIPSDVVQRSIESEIWNTIKTYGRILEIGIGNGNLTKLIFQKIKKIDVGIDIEESGLEMAMKTKIYNEVLKADASKLPFKNSTFGTIIANSTFEHIKKDKMAISESKRVLKKGGFLYLTVPSKEFKKIILEANPENFVRFNNRVEHYHYRDIYEWRKILEKENFKIIAINYYFPKEVVLFWYSLFSSFTKQIKNRELWSILSDPKIISLIPQELTSKFIAKFLYKKIKKYPIFSDKGGMIFIQAKKI